MDLGNTNIDDEGVTQLEALQQLTDFRINNTRVTHKVWESLRELENLTILYLGGTSVSWTNRGKQSLVKLRRLSFQGSTVITDGDFHWNKDIVPLENLDYLDLRGTGVSKSKIQSLQKSLAACKIQHGKVTDKATTKPTKSPKSP